jgi:hypothetical protein
MKIVIATIFSLMLAQIANARDCNTNDHAQIMAGLVARAADTDISVGERSLADIIGGQIRRGGYTSCVRNVVPATGDVVFLMSTTELAASLKFDGDSLVKIQAGNL